MTRWMNIGEAADAAGVSAKMVRHYEHIGLMPEASRTDAGYRQYGPRDVSILRFIRQSRRLGFSMAQIAELMGLWSNRDRSSREVKRLAQDHLDMLEQKMRELAEMQRALKALVQSCQGDDDPHCAILDGLAADGARTPEPGAVGAKPPRKPVPRRERERGSGTHRASARSDAFAELMAWTRVAQDPRGPL